jgi:hypothetical protein
VETILLGGLEPELSDRYHTAAEVERDVRHFLSDEPIEHKRPSAVRRLRQFLILHLQFDLVHL